MLLHNVATVTLSVLRPGGDDRIVPRRRKASERKSRLTRVIEPQERAREFKEL